MTQFVVSIDQNADFSLLKRIIENLKGVVNVSISKSNQSTSDTDTQLWIKKMKALSDGINKFPIDMDDERTKYLMSK